MRCVLWYFAAGGDTGDVLFIEMFTQGDKQVMRAALWLCFSRRLLNEKWNYLGRMQFLLPPETHELNHAVFDNTANCWLCHLNGESCTRGASPCAGSLLSTFFCAGEAADDRVQQFFPVRAASTPTHIHTTETKQDILQEQIHLFILLGLIFIWV